MWFPVGCDGQANHVQDVAAVVGDEGLVGAGLEAQLGLAAQRGQLARHGVARHRQHFHRQRELAHHFDQLGAVGDADEFLRYGGDDLFARQCRAAALDHGALLGDLVGAIDVDGDFGHVVQVQHGDAVAGQARGSRFGRRYGAFDAVLDLGQFVDEEVGRGAGADADDVTFHVGDGGAGNGLFQFVLSHD
jgi:hypothetical protein